VLEALERGKTPSAALAAQKGLDPQERIGWKNDR